MNQKTAQWLKSIKVPAGHINQTELKNGYLFGLIFEKLNLAKDKKFKNSHDLPCIFQNFKNAKDLLHDHFGIMFPANQIIYKSSQLLQKVKQACEQYQKNKKQIKLGEIKKKYTSINNNIQASTATNGEQKFLTLRQKQIKQQTLLGNNTLNPNKTFEPKMPPKILEIQKKLSKYKQEKTRHELLNLQTRKQELDSINQAIQDHRYFQMSKIKMNHDMIKQLEKRVADVVTKTQQQKQKRIDKDQQFFRFMKSKKDNFNNSLRNQEQNSFKQGLDDFQLNCLRQGIQLEHDPTKPYIEKQDNFNSKVMLQRIKDNIKDLQKQRKQRKKRANSKFVQTQQANLKSQKIWQQNYLLEKLQKNMTQHQTYIKHTFQVINFQKATADQIQLKLNKKTVKPLPTATQQEKQQFQAQLRANRMIYYDKQIERLQNKQKYLKNFAIEALESLLYTVIVAEQQQKNLNFTFSQWKHLQKVFIDYQSVPDDKRKKQISELEDKTSQQIGLFIDYIKGVKQMKTQSNTNQKKNFQQIQLASFVDSLIEQTYPKQKQSIQQRISTHMPLRIGITGPRLAGKTTQIKKILAKYPNIVLIDPKKILTDALQLAKPAPINQDPKKKKDPKKAQQQTPEKIELKKFGEQIIAQIKIKEGIQTQPVIDLQKIGFQYYLQAIRFKLSQSFKPMKQQQIQNKYKQSHEQQLQRLKDFQKNQEEKTKKKDSKKGQATEIIPQSPIFNEFFYIEGFVIDNIELNQQNLRLIEKDLNGFVKFEQRLNQNGQKLRQDLIIILPIKKSQIPTNLNKGFFNILIDLNAEQQSLQQRNQGRKQDPQTGEIYHPKFNPVPTDIKGLAERLVEVKKVEIQSLSTIEENKQKRQKFYNVFGFDEQKQHSYHKIGNLSVQETNFELIRILQSTLKLQYQRITSYRSVQTQKQQNSLEEDKKQNQQRFYEGQQNAVEKIPVVKNKPAKRQESASLLKKLISFKSSYELSVNQQLSQFQKIRQSFEDALLIQQRYFLQIINRPDDKANRILTFQDNFNKLLEEKGNIINDKQAINHLVSKLDELYDSLWINIQAKKNEAIQKRKSIMVNNWLDEEIKKIVESGKQILQTELNYLVDILSFILIIQLQREGKNSQPVIDYLCLGVPKENQPIQSVISSNSDQKVSPRLQFYIDQVDSCLSSLPEWYAKKQSQSKIKLSSELQNLAISFIQKQKIKIQTTIQYLKQWLYSFIQEEVCYFKALINKMDDWIIFGIKDQNQFTYTIYKQLKSSIQKVFKSQLKDLFPTPITTIIKSIESLTKLPLPLPFNNTKKQTFDYSSYKIFLEELKCLRSFINSSQNSEIPRINFSRFKEYFNKRKKSKLLSEIYLRLDFDTMQQFLVTENEANFREVALALLLWNQNVLDEQKINSYHDKLSGVQKQKTTLSDPSQLILSNLLNSRQISKHQVQCLQHLVFDVLKNDYTNQVSIKQFIEILRTFNSLELFKYGDSLMMLNQQKIN